MQNESLKTLGDETNNAHGSRSFWTQFWESLRGSFLGHLFLSWDYQYCLVRSISPGRPTGGMDFLQNSIASVHDTCSTGRSVRLK
jgi:hypothetical protein